MEFCDTIRDMSRKEEQRIRLSLSQGMNKSEFEERLKRMQILDNEQEK